MGTTFFFLLTQRMPLILASRILHSRPGSAERFRRYSRFILDEKTEGRETEVKMRLLRARWSYLNIYIRILNAYILNI